MKAESISDQKRVVRAEHWLLARQLLRARDNVHHAKWRVLTIADPRPNEEIDCIRDLMPKAHITAVDIDDLNVFNAKASGADIGLRHNLNEFDSVKGKDARKLGGLAPSAKLGAPFDAICLDLTGPASGDLAKLVRVYRMSLTKRGVLLATFSYGRDVLEFFAEHWHRKLQEPSRKQETEPLLRIDMPEKIRMRISYLLSREVTFLRSVIQYRGGAMPMVSLLLANDDRANLPPAKFKSINDSDFETFAILGNLDQIYACPADRIDAVRLKRDTITQQMLQNQRRSLIAKNAVATKKRKAGGT